MTQFFPRAREIAAKKNDRLFPQSVYRLHGLPRVLVSDKYPRFLTPFWQTLWRRFGTKFDMSSSRHIKIFGLARASSTFQQFMRCYTCYDESDRVNWLSQVGFAYTACHALGIEHPSLETNFGFSHEEPPNPMLHMRPSIHVSTTTRKDR
jgi:putative transposase